MCARYICVSETCRRESEIEVIGKNGTFFSPTCDCGSEMKRVYSAPAFTLQSGAEATQRFGEFVGERKG